MQCFMIVFLYIPFVLGSEGITTHSVTECIDRVRLNCSNTEKKHLERITYYNGTDCNQAVTDLQVCGQPVTGSDTELIPSCNAKTTCNVSVYYNFCPGSKAAKVDYRCIPGNNFKDMCEELIIENTNIIFLSTPLYPSGPTFTDISPCRCSILGSSITSIQILELALLTSGDGTKSSLEINYGDGTFKAESFRKLFNKRLSRTSTTAEIILNHNGINEQDLWRQYLWIEVQGVGMRVFCNDDSHAISKESSQDKDTVIILAVLWPLSIILIICITAIIIIVLLRRKKLVCVNRRESNLYSGLDRTQRVSGSDGSYQELNTMNPTPQYYNTSQNTQHDYQYVS